MSGVTRALARPVAARVSMRSVWAVLLFAVLAAACGVRGKTVAPPERITLRVDNRGYFDVTVYALRAAGSGTRLGNISGGSSGTLYVRLSDLQPGGRLVIQLRALGTRRTWTSSPVSVADGLRARLTVLSSNSGDMSQSSLIADYTGNDGP